MTLPSELLPAMQHYSLLAAALTVFTLSFKHVKRPLGTWVWLVVFLLPIIQIAWSLWETINEVAGVEGTYGQPPLGSHSTLIVVQALIHGLAISLVSAMVLYIANRSHNKLPRRVKLEPTIG